MAEIQLPVEVVLAWLDARGGRCDCAVLAHVEQAVDEALAARRG